MRLTLIALISAALVGLSGCASDQSKSSDASAQAKPAKDTRPKEERLKAGMTKDEVREAIGNPTGTSVSSDGEATWMYRDTAKAFIPFYSVSGGKFQTLVVNFDKDGKVRNWSSNTQGAY